MKDQEADRSDARKFIQPRVEYMDLKEISTERNTKEQSAPQVADYEPLRSSTRSRKVPRDHVFVEKIIDKGAFGQVAKGTADQFQERPGATTIAIKMLKSMILHILKIVLYSAEIFMFALFVLTLHAFKMLSSVLCITVRIIISITHASRACKSYALHVRNDQTALHCAHLGV